MLRRGSSEPTHPALRNVYWREEVIELVLWLRGEGFDEQVDADLLARCCAIDRASAAAHLERLTEHGYLHAVGGGRYALTGAGEDEARRIVGTARAVPLPTVGPCGATCWCATSPIEAASCAGARFH